MSKPHSLPSRPSFTSRTVFESLAVEELYSEPEDDIVHVEVEPLPSVEPAPEEPPEPAEAPSPPAQPSRSAKTKKKATPKPSTVKVPPVIVPVLPLPEETAATSQPADPALTVPSSDAKGATVSEPSPAPPANPPPPSLPSLKPTSSPSRARSPSRPQTDTGATPFSPTLPDPLPQPASTGLGPRKRKASQDLTSNPFSKDPKVEAQSADRKSSTDVSNGHRIATATMESGQKVGVVELAVIKGESTPNGNHGADHEKGKRMQQAVTRTIWTLIMIGGFVTLLLAGPPYMILLVFLIQGTVYREVTALFGLTSPPNEQIQQGTQKDPWSKTLNWYFFGITNYFLYGESLIYYFKHVIYADVRFLPFANNHRFISFMLYVFAFMGFVASLNKQFLRQQFGLFGWVHMSLLVIVVSSHFIVNNILEGIIWFWIPASLVICNDVFAYVWGMIFGKTPLIKLSPKKTVEGFVGAFFSTIIFGYLWATFFMRFNYMICPAVDLGVSAWSDVQCRPNPVFVWRSYEVPGPVQTFMSSATGIQIPPIPWAPFQFHALIMATFASLVAPFGGFFASGFKRAFDIKDFGHSIPGHGGMTDRMDCQFLMGMFAYVYYSSLIRVHRATVGSVLQTIVSSLSTGEQLELLGDLHRYLEGSGVL